MWVTPLASGPGGPDWEARCLAHAEKISRLDGDSSNCFASLIGTGSTLRVGPYLRPGSRMEQAAGPVAQIPF